MLSVGKSQARAQFYLAERELRIIHLLPSRANCLLLFRTPGVHHRGRDIHY